MIASSFARISCFALIDIAKKKYRVPIGFQLPRSGLPYRNVAMPIGRSTRITCCRHFHRENLENILPFPRESAIFVLLAHACELHGPLFA